MTELQKVPAVSCRSYEELEQGKTPGAYWIGNYTVNDHIEYGMWYRCPLDGHLAYLPLNRNRPASAPTWDWDGNYDTPTLNPSILDRGCGWHGYLRNGVWEPC